MSIDNWGWEVSDGFLNVDDDVDVATGSLQATGEKKEVGLARRKVVVFMLATDSVYEVLLVPPRLIGKSEAAIGAELDSLWSDWLDDTEDEDDSRRYTGEWEEEEFIKLLVKEHGFESVDSELYYLES